MAKKKYRDIVVDGVKYAWMVRDYYDELPDLIIWKDKKEIIKYDVQYGDVKITPSFVAEKIKEYETKH